MQVVIKYCYLIFISLILLSPTAFAQYEGLAAEELLAEFDIAMQDWWEVNAAMEENRQTQEELRDLTNQISEENETLEQEVSDFNAALDQFNAEISSYERQCAGQSLSTSAFEQCESWRLDMETRNMALTRQGETIADNEADYSDRVDELNRRLDERLNSAQELIRSSQQHEARIDLILEELAGINLNYQACIGLMADALQTCIDETLSIPVPQ